MRRMRSKINRRKREINMPEKIFFQSSMPRSLSTTFQNLLGQNPDFYVTPTSGVLELLFGARANYTTSPEFKAQDAYLMRKGFVAFCKNGLEGYYAAITDRKYVMDKSRGWGVYRSFLDAVYPDPKIICMVRNLKDVVASYEKIYRKSPDKHDPVRDDSKATGTTVHKRVDEWMHPTNTIGRAVERIFEMIRLGYDDKILFVKAEDLCLYPETEMVRVYDYLGIPYYKHDFDNIEQITTEDDAVYGLAPDLHVIRPKLEMKASDAGIVLGKDICTWLYDNYKWYYDKFKYQK
jgi:sulfotransferase